MHTSITLNNSNYINYYKIVYSPPPPLVHLLYFQQIHKRKFFKKTEITDWLYIICLYHVEHIMFVNDTDLEDRLLRYSPCSGTGHPHIYLQDTASNDS